ncbi:hypothetical protein [Streptomyces griseorubiginosus]|uniref:hypothetical protein n=1 Tax=Streptomyces griseorubiginosus TaxID=67304 RepID=UPI0036E25B6E
MTPNEIQMLIVGTALGAQFMNILHSYWSMKDASRAAAAAKASAKRAAADRYFHSLRIYQIDQRSRV